MLQPEVTSVLTGSCNIETRSHRIFITINGSNINMGRASYTAALTVVKRCF